MTENTKKEIPSIEIRIDKDGVWYYRGNEMFRQEILELFYQSLVKDQEGRYLIQKDGQTFYIEVEDTPYVVKSLEFSTSEKSGNDGFNILLSDNSIEKLDLETLRRGEGNILYCSIKNNLFEARFTRQSYYQLAEYIQHEPEKDRYYITLNDRTYELP